MRERKLLRMEEAVRKMTGLPASIVGLTERGEIRQGGYADIVIFSPGEVQSTATWSQPALPPVGIDFVIVNGCIQVEGSRMSSRDCGRLLRKSGENRSFSP